MRAIQDMRKEAGYDVSDRIVLSVSGGEWPVVRPVFADFIAGETLAMIREDLTDADITRAMEVEGQSYHITLKR